MFIAQGGGEYVVLGFNIRPRRYAPPPLTKRGSFRFTQHHRFRRHRRRYRLSRQSYHRYHHR